MSDFNIKKIEEKILRFWNDRKIFERSVEERQDGRRFVFFEGPPTANGQPGIHHFIGRVFKDLWPRYKTMRGYFVPRKAGWDTHGLPVEIEVEKELKFTNKQQIEKYGIAKFNARAKKSVWKYKEEWQKFVKRIGHWIDLGDPYITYDPKYMESLWWVIQQFDKKKLLYEGHKVLPWCPRCGTALSSHELAQGYKEVTDTAVVWKFQISSATFLLAWTTTPWSTISTMGLSVGPDIEYIKAKVRNEYLIVAKERAEAVLSGLTTKYEIVETVKGSDLVGLEYEPLLDLKGPYKVYPADYVEVTEGTGIVTINGSYGEIDMEQAKKHKLPIVMDVDPDGKFNKHAGPYAGMAIKKGQAQFIIDMQKRGLVWKVDAYTHSYPHCWRCKTPLIYYARHSWFVAMSKLRDKLLKNNATVNWVPEHLRDGRFGEFLREVKDWAFSRERYWGTPLPVWKCTNCTHHIVIGSLEELEKHRYRKPNAYLLLRHGHSTHNENNIIEIDFKHDTSRLTEKGKQQIAEAAQKIKNLGGADLIVASPFVRTKETAEIVAKTLNIDITIDKRLIEYQMGAGWNGKKISDWYEASKNRLMSDKFPDGESWHESKLRMMSVLHDLEKKYEGKRIVIVSHGEALWALKTFFMEITENAEISRREELTPKNGEVDVISLPNHPYNKDGELDLHRPYIDEIKLKCEKCGHEMRRVPEVADVWFDSGAMPYAQWHYPFENADIFKKNFPADFIAEAIDQTRGWFYTLLAISTALGYKAPYKNVISYSHVLDEKGKKMSKSIGNAVDPWDVIKQYGVDAARWYFYSVNTPGDPKLFVLADVANVQRGFLGTLMNCLRFFELYEARTTRHETHVADPETPLDRWVLSRLHRTINTVTEALDAYDPTMSSRTLENFIINDLSNWWIRRSRESISENTDLLRYLLAETSKLIAPFIPFTAEHIYKSASNRNESVHLENWPQAKNKYINDELETQMIRVREIVTQGLALRKTVQIKVRQPLVSLSVKFSVPAELHYLLKDELNVKQILFAPSQTEDVTLDTAITHELKLEGYARELARAIQDMRKDAKYKLRDKVRAAWSSSNPDIVQTIKVHGAKIMADTLLKALDKVPALEGKWDVKTDVVLGSGKVMVGIRK